MIFKNINKQSKTVTGAALIIGVATLISRIIGLVRDRILSHHFGAGAVMDSYFAAFKIPDLIFTLLVVGALAAGFIPTFTKLFFEDKDDKSEAWKLANNILNITGVTLIVLCVLGIIFAPYLIPVITPGFNDTNQLMTINYSRIMFLSPIFLGLSMTLGGILQSLRRFVLYSIAPIFYNLGIIIGAAVLTKFFGPIALAWGVVLGAILHFSLQLVGAIASGWRWKWRFKLKDKNTRLIGKLMIPRTLGLSITEINILVITILASWLPIGSVSAYNYANNIQAVPTGIIGVSFALAVFPVLSAAAAKGDTKNFIINLSSTARQILFLIIPLSAIILLLRAQIVRVILGSGEFDWASTIATADALAFFSFGLFAQSLIPLLARAFYSLSDTKTPFITGLIAEVIAIGSALLLMKPLGVAGLALACSIGAIINFALLTLHLRQKTGIIDGDRIIYSLYRISIATVIMSLIIQMAKNPLSKLFNLDYFWGVFGQGVVASVLGLLIYLIICWILKVPEFIQLRESFKKRWLKIKNVETIAAANLIETTE